MEAQAWVPGRLETHVWAGELALEESLSHEVPPIDSPLGILAVSKEDPR